MPQRDLNWNNMLRASRKAMQTTSSATTQRVALQLREVAIRSKRVTLRAAREAAESTGLMSGFLSLGLSLLLTPVLLLSPFSRKLQWRIFGLPLGRAVFVVYCLWVYGFDRSVCPKGGRPVSWVRFNLLTRLIRSYFRCKVTPPTCNFSRARSAADTVWIKPGPVTAERT